MKGKIPANLMEKLFSISYNRSHIEFAAWLGAMNGLYRLVICTCRWLMIKYGFGDAKHWPAPIAGFFAGLCLMLNSNKVQRNFIMSLLMSRLADILMNKYL